MKNGSRGKWLVGIAIFVVLASAVGIGGYFVAQSSLASSDQTATTPPSASDTKEPETISPTALQTPPPSSPPTTDTQTPHHFNISLVYTDPGTPAHIKEAFEFAAEKWSSLITTDWINLRFEDGGNLGIVCSDPASSIDLPQDYFLDDLLIVVNVGPIDGGGTEADGNILGQAYNCFFYPEREDEPRKPRIGVMVFDEYDLSELTADGSLHNVVLHEMGHVLGIGTLWQFDDMNLILGANTTDPRYTGEGGIRGLRTVTNGDVGVQPKVEADGGAGTALGHWDEVEYDHELMTGFVEVAGIEMPLSALTAMSLADLGYTIDESKIDPYTLPEVARRLSESSPKHHMVHDTLQSIFLDLETLDFQVTVDN